MLEKGGSNWVEGSKFFDREAELETLEERIRGGTHTLLTAQRRMGKTSLVRELLRRLRETGDFDTVFVDLESAMGPADAIAEVGIRTKSIRGASSRKNETFANKWGISIGRNGEIQSVSTKTVYCETNCPKRNGII